MRTINTLFFLIFFMIAASEMEAQNWQLVWQDEFTNEISPDWVFETGRGNSGWGNNELQYYRRENATVENGQLIITAKRQNFGDANYTSARMKTQGRKSFKYGKIEARIALPTGQGLWPAFWMLGNDISSVGWPACGEIDIIEHINTAPDVHGTIHWQDQNGNYANYGGHTAINANNYHLYTIEWNENTIKWFIDGNQFHEVNISNGINGTSEFHNEYFLLLNLAVGGNWPGFSVDDSRLPARMSVDYVRVYKDDANGGGNGVATFYKHCTYDGYTVSLAEGSYTRSQLIAAGIQDDDISSLKVQSGYQATLYFHDNFTGNSITKTGDTNCLADDGFNDEVTSLRISKASQGGGQTIEAENYSSMSGVQKENCSEGGQNVGYIDTGDWMAYANVNFPTSGNYRIEYRVASATGGGTISADLNGGTTLLGQVSIPNTGGWQNWTTVSHTANVTAGTYPFGMYASSGGWNINWIKITSLNSAKSVTTQLASEKLVKNSFEQKTRLFPIPAINELNLRRATKGSNISIVNLYGQLIKKIKIDESDNDTKIDISSLKSGVYFINMTNDTSSEVIKFIKK